VNNLDPKAKERTARAAAEVSSMLERTARHYPADLPCEHYARRTNWRYQPRRAELSAFAQFDPLRSRLEAARAQAEERLVSERLGDVILDAQQREDATRRALGIMPNAEADRLREVIACPEIQPRHFIRSAPATVSVFEQVERNLGRATAIAYCMLVLAGKHTEEELLRYGERLDRVFSTVVSAPAVRLALEAEVPVEAPGKFDVPLALLQAVYEQLWLLKPARASAEFLLTHVIDNCLGAKSGAGNDLGLALFDSVIIGKLGFCADIFVDNGRFRLQVPVASRSVSWEPTERRPLSYSQVSSGSVVDRRSLFAHFYGSLAAMCSARGLWPRSAEACQRTLELDPNSVRAHTDLAVSYLRQQMPDDAIRELNTCLDLEPDAADVHNQLGNAFAMRSDWRKAIDSYKRALRTNRDAAEVYNNLGFAYLHADNEVQAIAAFEAAIAKRPDYYQAHFNLANLHLEKQRFDLALEHYRETVRIEPTFTAAYYNMGRAQYESHDLDGSVRSYQRAVELNPKHFGAWHNLGIVYRDLGQTDKAVESLEKALALNPNLMR
jgi:tetratricopeptide (TPR) repeat protein